MKLRFSQVSVELRRRQDDHVRLRLIQTLLLLRGAHSSPEEKHISELTQWLRLPLRPPSHERRPQRVTSFHPQHQTNEPITGNQQPLQPAGHAASSCPADRVSRGFVCPLKRINHTFCVHLPSKHVCLQTCRVQGVCVCVLLSNKILVLLAKRGRGWSS